MRETADISCLCVLHFYVFLVLIIHAHVEIKKYETIQLLNVLMIIYELMTQMELSEKFILT